MSTRGQRHVVLQARRQPLCRLRSLARVARAGGQALLLVITLLSLASIVLVYGSTTEAGRALKAEARTRSALEHAREALIGRAVADANRPGSLPCPDTNDDGSADLFVGSACPSYIGRLPWRTLGIGDLRDETGERLWYALSSNFRDHPSAPQLNSDTKGTLSVYHTSTATTVTTQAVAVIFAPGVLLPGQRRDTAPALCSSTGTTIARNRCATNYLDVAASINNANSSGPFVGTAAGEFFNDKIAVVTTADLMPLIEQRVALEVRNALLAYKATSACKCYPWADAGNDGVSDSGANRGRIPYAAALPDAWGAGVLPPYFVANGWARVLYYASARSALHNAGESCKTCTHASLSVDAVEGYDVVLITPGFAGAARPSTAWADYLEDAENRNGDDRFVTPSSHTADRDRMYFIASHTIGCPAQARILVDNAPCGAPGGAVRPACQAAAAALSTCTCAAAAGAIVKAPCTHSLTSTMCESAVSTLQVCTL